MTNTLKNKVRIITLPSGRSVTIGEYVRSWRALRAMHPQTIVGGWDDFNSTPAGEILAEMSRGVHDRINRHLPWWGKGREQDPNREAEVRRAAYDLNSPRLRIYSLPSGLKERFAHRLCRRDD